MRIRAGNGLVRMSYYKRCGENCRYCVWLLENTGMARLCFVSVPSVCRFVCCGSVDGTFVDCLSRTAIPGRHRGGGGPAAVMLFVRSVPYIFDMNGVNDDPIGVPPVCL